MQISKTFIAFSQAFVTTSESVADFFAQPGIGYYIPLYQREYSWDLENINQLMDDLCQGTELLLDKDEAILFMGTIILLTEPNPHQNIKPRDPRALPSRIDNVIDGQQRISTLALLATLLHQRLREVGKTLKSVVSKSSTDANFKQQIDALLQEIELRLSSLAQIFTLSGRGTPPLKPVIIRGSVDCWTFDGPVDTNYISEVSRHLASVIDALENDGDYTLPQENSTVKRNLRRMNEYLDDVIKAHEKNEDFPPAWRILQGAAGNGLQEQLWGYQRTELVDAINNRATPPTKVEAALCSVVQLLAFTNFLLNRCCFTVIKPTAETWAFDMFQSLNATGTPLTAVETFKPMVSNYCGMNGGFKGSKSDGYFQEVDNFLGQATSANTKNRLTNEFLTTFALVQDGTKLPSQFSVQRRYLEASYNNCATPADHEEFVRRMADLAFYRHKVSDIAFDAQTRIPLTEGAPDDEREMAALCVAYLKKANHKMADTILSRFYALLRRADDTTRPAARDDFLAACKAVAAFFTLWRAASSNSGLDDVYRRAFRQDGGKMSWTGDPKAFTLANVKQHLSDALTQANIGDKSKWMNRAEVELRYANGVDQVCRFALLLAAHDTTPDPATPGLMVAGKSGLQKYLSLEKWLAPDLSSIEHIAPQTNDARTPWDATLYEDEVFQRIGNLTLLPREINSSAGNKGWLEKCLYYRYLTVTNPTVDHPIIEAEAAKQGIVLNPQTTAMLKDAQHKAHIVPIARLGMAGQWDRALVEARTQRICDLLWERISPWLR